jgi:hypothetical protein
MALLYASGGKLVEKKEFFETAAKGKVPKARAYARTLRLPKWEPTYAIKTITPGEGAAESGMVPFKPVGVGKPLTIMIHQIYAGKYPRPGWHQASAVKDMLATSAVKSPAVYDAKPRALNYLVSKVRTGDTINRPSAASKGTPIVFYSPSLVDESLTLDLSFAFDDFPDELFKQVGDTLQSAAGVPIFLPYSAYILGLSGIVKLAGRLGNKLFDARPEFTTSDALNFQLPGYRPFPAGFALVTDRNVNEIDPKFLDECHVDAEGQVVDASRKKYGGDVPFVVISLDGTAHDEYKSFTPTAVAAAILSRFYASDEGQQENLNDILDAVKLFSDMHFRKEVDKLDDQLKDMSKEDPQYAELSQKRDAMAKNILTDLLKKKS